MLSGKRFQATIQRNGRGATSMSVSKWVSESDCQKEQQQAHKQGPQQWHSSSNCESIVTWWRNWRATQDDEFMGGWDCAGGQNGKVPVPWLAGWLESSSRVIKYAENVWTIHDSWLHIYLFGIAYNAMATDSTHRTTRGKRTRRVSFKGKEPQHAIIMFLPCHPYKVNRGGDNRDDPRRILEDFVDCVWIGREGRRDESSAQAQRDGGGGFGGLVVGCLRSKLGEHCRSHKPHTKSGQ